MIKGLTINNVHTYKDLGLMISKRNISIPQVNKIKESVPYQNGEYDFSNLNGEMTYQNRMISYTFDILESSTEKMEETKRKILNWAMSVVEKEIYDDYLSGYHFVGSYESSSWNEDFEQAELTLEFSVYPYLYANEITIKKFEIHGETEVILDTESSHRIIPAINCNGDILITRGNTTIAIGEGTFEDVDFYLEPKNVFLFSGNGVISFSYINEVL